MSIQYQKLCLRIYTFLIIIFMLLVSLALDKIPARGYQDSSTPLTIDTHTATPTDDQVDELVTTSDDPVVEDDLQSETPTFTPSPTSTNTKATPSSTNTQIGLAAAAEINPEPLPARFFAGAYMPDEFIVRFKRTTAALRISQCLEGIDVAIESEIEEFQTLVLSVISGDVGGTFRHVHNCAGVLYVEPNYMLSAADTFPNDPDWGLEYGLVSIRAPQGWDLATGSSAVTIAILDSGVDLSHADLAVKIVPGYDFVNGDAVPQDDYGHGTHVAGIAAASSNNGTGISGVSWGARIMPVKVLNSAGSNQSNSLAIGIIDCILQGR